MMHDGERRGGIRLIDTRLQYCARCALCQSWWRDVDSSDFPSTMFHEVTTNHEYDASLLLRVRCRQTVKQHGSKVIKYLRQNYPLPGYLKHLKRVRPLQKEENNLMGTCLPSDVLEILIAVEGQEHWATLTEDLAFLKYVSTTSYSVLIPRQRPPNRALYEEARKYWPMSFHQGRQDAQDAISDEFFKTAVKYMKRVMYGELGTSSSPKQTEVDKGNVVFIDPSSDTILAEWFDGNGGLDNPLNTPIMQCIRCIANRNVGQKKRNSRATQESSPYLCRGYDVYLEKEPDAMDAMALLHSRVGRVFFAGQTNGVLGRVKLHTLNGVNHRYRVFVYNNNTSS